ncbi:MAG: alpha-galactosidase [Bacteroidetes bacterium]|nr:alpha-galactosidase [Bacteroidota bacterium]
MRKIFSTIIILLSFLSNNIAQSSVMHLKPELKIEGAVEPFMANLNLISDVNGILTYKFELISDREAVPGAITITWDVPVINISTLWKSNSSYQKFLYPNWSSNAKITSRTTNNAPVMSLVSYDDENQLTFACSDALNTITLSAGLREEDATFACEIKLFREKTSPLKSYTTYIRLDTREIHFSECLQDVSDWWEEFPDCKPVAVPEQAKLPMYSSWYSFHQNLVVEDLLEQCRLAKRLGYETIIIDDGWQTLDSNRGYSFTGDWKPERIPNMKEFVQKVHDIGMKFMLWYSVPYIGDKAENFKKFEGKYLTYWGGEWGGSYTLDPRYPDVREFLISTYENAVKEWNLDGFKLDFVDEFIAYDDTELTIDNGRDYASVNEAVDRLLTDITSSLHKLNPDILIEFRQSYIGPLMRKYGNMFRAGDCPDSYIFNRIRTTDLKLTSGNTAVHSDMLMWNKDEPVESAALQMLNVMFSVPQLSVKISELSADHYKMVEFLTKYWLDNREVLLSSQFIPYGASLGYPLLSAQSEGKIIFGLYSDRVINLDEFYSEINILNGKMTGSVVLNIAKDLGNVSINVYNCLGDLQLSYSDRLNKGLEEIKVPVAGIIKIKKR